MYVIEHDLAAPPSRRRRPLDGHGMDPDAVLALMAGLASSMGVERPVERVLVVGCEPASLDEAMGLSTPVAAAVERAAQIVLDLTRELVMEGARTMIRKLLVFALLGIAAGAIGMAVASRDEINRYRDDPPDVKEPSACASAFPGEVIELMPDHDDLAIVSVEGVKRAVNIGLLAEEGAGARRLDPHPRRLRPVQDRRGGGQGVAGLPHGSR